jgi:lysophospholipase L1-like esterase
MWTGRLRARLQARFGDAGPGLLLPARPWRGFAHAGVDLEFGRKWPATSLREAGTDGLVGLTGAALMLPEQEALRVRGFFRGFEVTTHASGSAGPDVGLVRSEPAPATPAGAAALLSPEVLTCAPTHTALRLESGGLLRIDAQRGLSDEAPLELRVSVPVGDRLLGIELFSGRPGLLYDELGLNGAEVTDLLRWNAEVRRLLLARARADLIVLAYGTNEMGRNAGELAVYAEQVRQILATLRAESGAPILVIGPIDRGSRRSSLVRRLRISEPLVGAALRSAAIRSGAAYWDARSAMGGAGSITRWQRQGMAQRDLVHLTGRGYERLGDLLADALLLAFDDYRARQAAALSPAAPAGGFP